MRLFTLIDFHHFLLGLFLGVAAAVVIYLAFRFGGRGAGKNDESIGGDLCAQSEEYPEGLRIGNNPVPPVLVFVFIGFAVWFIFYVIFFGIFGKPV
jgi:hypothetical protein